MKCVWTTFLIIRSCSVCLLRKSLTLDKEDGLSSKDYDMSLQYHTCKVNVVADAFSRLSIGSLDHVDKEKRDLVKETFIVWLTLEFIT